MKTDPRPRTHRSAILPALLVAAVALAACDPSESAGPLADEVAEEPSAETPASTDTTGTPADTVTSDPEGDSTSTPSSDPEAPAGQLQPVDTLFASTISGVETARRELIGSQEAWAEAWAELNATVDPAPEAPAVDFGAHRVLVLTMGSRPTGGYSIDVESLTVDDGTLVVTVRETEPGATCMLTQAVTRPAFAATVPVGDVEVVFEETSVVEECG